MICFWTKARFLEIPSWNYLFPTPNIMKDGENTKNIDFLLVVKFIFKCFFDHHLTVWSVQIFWKSVLSVSDIFSGSLFWHKNKFGWFRINRKNYSNQVFIQILSFSSLFEHPVARITLKTRTWHDQVDWNLSEIHCRSWK